jgi:hypothetical protein
MNRARRNNRLRRYGRPPPAETSDRWAANGADDTQPATECRHLQSADRLRGKTEEAGLTLVPPSRYRSLFVPLVGEPFGEHALPLALGIAHTIWVDPRTDRCHGAADRRISGHAAGN